MQNTSVTWKKRLCQRLWTRFAGNVIVVIERFKVSKCSKAGMTDRDYITNVQFLTRIILLSFRYIKRGVLFHCNMQWRKKKGSNRKVKMKVIAVTQNSNQVKFLVSIHSSGSMQIWLLSTHRMKSHVSVFLKRGGNMQFYVSVIFTSRGNVKTQVLRHSVTFPERKLSSHVSAMFKLADFRYCAFPSCFCKRIYSCLLHLPKHKPSRWFLEQQWILTFYQ